MSPNDGGGFDYVLVPKIFLGRVGTGPLRIGWDTSVLIDWVTYGHLLQGDLELPVDLGTAYAEELTALGMLVDFWMTRDIRIYPLRWQSADMGKHPSSDLEADRQRQLDRLAEAIWHTIPEEDYPNELELGFDQLPEFGAVPNAIDRLLVEEAVVSGCHVLLTRDQKMISWSVRTEVLGLQIGSPTRLVHALAETGELNQPFGADGLVCDSHKWQHLFEVCAGSTDES